MLYQQVYNETSINFAGRKSSFQHFWKVFDCWMTHSVYFRGSCNDYCFVWKMSEEELGGKNDLSNVIYFNYLIHSRLFSDYGKKVLDRNRPKDVFQCLYQIYKTNVKRCLMYHDHCMDIIITCDKR